MAKHKVVQRLEDLHDISDNKEIKLLCNIVKQFVNEESKVDIGFRAKLGGGDLDGEEV